MTILYWKSGTIVGVIFCQICFFNQWLCFAQSLLMFFFQVTIFIYCSINVNSFCSIFGLICTDNFFNEILNINILFWVDKVILMILRIQINPISCFSLSTQSYGISVASGISYWKMEFFIFYFFFFIPPFKLKVLYMRYEFL